MVDTTLTKLERWDKECSLDISLPELATIVPITDRDITVWTSRDLSLKVYPLKCVVLPDGLKQNELGGLEYEITLLKKPVSNILSLAFNTKGLEFVPQPLVMPKPSPDAICYTPENVLGSIAVYRDKPPVYASQAEAEKFRAGKFGHIYRPQLMEATGKKIWADIKVREGYLDIIIDKDWLKAAIYPVVIDPNFGYETKGGTQFQAAASTTYGTKFTGASGTAQSITAFTYTTDASSLWQYALYTDDAAPLALMDNTVEVGGAFNDWKTAALETTQEITAVSYWLQMLRGTVTYIYWYYDAGAASQENYGPVTYPSWPAEFTPNGYNSVKFSVYCTYSTGEAAAYLPRVMMF